MNGSFTVWVITPAKTDDLLLVLGTNRRGNFDFFSINAGDTIKFNTSDMAEKFLELIQKYVHIPLEVRETVVVNE